ncbi:alpha/beta hydrolase family protein [Salinispira pacifica]|uniref:Lipase n=1 Tax=Salinispira pacifica TaxID=1307761 RepID=V5WJ69_9SPIO|nr:hypothetical protein [Salinispira pacifica]AHC15675.1 hypothetical protein L21SP2_2318 [Salinispira pacifica]
MKSQNVKKLSVKKIVMTAVIAAASLIAVGVLFLWGVAMPVRNLPEPSGAYPVGTIAYDLVDESRMEAYSADRQHRKIRVQLWYPAEQPDGRPKPEDWMIDGPRHTRAIVNTHGFPPFIWDHTRFMKSNSFSGLTPAEDAGPMPVILISHGWEGYRGLHADIAEELASRGFLVAATEHSYGSAGVLFEDGRIVRSSDDVLPDRNQRDSFILEANRLVKTFSRDNAFLLDQLTLVNSGMPHAGPQRLSMFRNRMDIERTGLIGHSTGGGAMVHFALSDPRPDALMAYDAWVEPVASGALERDGYSADEGFALTRTKLDIPALFYRSEDWNGGINDGYLVPFVQAQDGTEVGLQEIAGTTHQQFTALYMYAPVVRWLGMLGEVDPFDFARRLRMETGAFFSDQLLSAAEEQGE